MEYLQNHADHSGPLVDQKRSILYHQLQGPGCRDEKTLPLEKDHPIRTCFRRAAADRQYLDQQFPVHHHLLGAFVSRYSHCPEGYFRESGGLVVYPLEETFRCGRQNTDW